MAKDLLDDRFGRFRELPLELARLGHDVTGVCLSYRARQEGLFKDCIEDSNAHVSWYSLNLGGLIVPGLKNYRSECKRLVSELKPDIIWACSDSFQVVFGVWLGKLTNTKCVVDLYDNFEAFTATRLTGILPLFKRAVRDAHGVTSFSKRLADHVILNYQRKRPTIVAENGVRTDFFYPQERLECRRHLGLPEKAKIFGTAGALYKNRDVATLFRSFELLNSGHHGIHLAIAGPRERRVGIPNGSNVHDLGILPWDQVPFLINALDVAVSCYRDTRLGRYSFPQKAYEIMACRIPLVAAAVGSMKELLEKQPECLFEPENPGSLATAVRHQLLTPTKLDLEIPSWSDIAKRLEAFFTEILEADLPQKR